MDLHPFFTHFPIALLVLVVLLECISVAKPLSAEGKSIIDIILWMVVVTVVVSFFTGFEASESANKTFIVDDAAIGAHYSWARLLLFVAPTAAIFHYASIRADASHRVFRLLYLLTLVMSVILVLIVGYHGGELVFRHGAGVEATFPMQR